MKMICAYEPFAFAVVSLWLIGNSFDKPCNIASEPARRRGGKLSGLNDLYARLLPLGLFTLPICPNLLCIL